MERESQDLKVVSVENYQICRVSAASVNAPPFRGFLYDITSLYTLLLAVHFLYQDPDTGAVSSRFSQKAVGAVVYVPLSHGVKEFEVESYDQCSDGNVDLGVCETMEYDGQWSAHRYNTSGSLAHT